MGNNWDEVFFLIKLWSETNNFTIIGFLNKFFLCEFCEVFESFSFTRRGVLEHCQRSDMEFIMKIVHGNYFHKKLYLRCLTRFWIRLWLGKVLHEKCPYSEFFWSVFCRIRTEYGQLSRSETFFHNVMLQIV